MTTITDLAAALSEIERLRADAERYRFLRRDFGQMASTVEGQPSWAYRRNFSLHGPTLDDAIDAALDAAKEQK